MPVATVQNPLEAGSEQLELELEPRAQGDVPISRAELVDARMAEMEDKLREKGEDVESILKGALSRLDAAPLNFHQVVVFFLTLPAIDEGDAAKRRAAPWLFVLAVVMVLLQCMAVSGVIVDMYMPSCSSNDMCDARGTYCCIGCEKLDNRCNFCGTASPIPMESLPDGTVRNHAAAVNFVGFNLTAVNKACTPPIKAMGATPQQDEGYKSSFSAEAVEAWCEACVKFTGKVDPTSPIWLTKTNVLAMGIVDWGTYAIASYIVALNVAGELKDVFLIDRAIGKAHGSGTLGKGWCIAIYCLNCLRRWCFCTTLNALVILLTAFKGGGAVSVCLNTVAVRRTQILYKTDSVNMRLRCFSSGFKHVYAKYAGDQVLFLTEVDNLSYALGLPESWKTRVEKDGRVELQPEEEEAIAQSKTIHVVLTTASLIAGLAYFLTGNPEGLLFPWLAFVLAGIVEVSMSGALLKEIVLGLAKVLVSFVVGFSAFWEFGNLAGP